MRQKSKLFLINGTILTSTALLMKFAALIFNIYISNQIGSEAVGIFSLVMAVYLFFITVATSGLNIAVTVIVSEKFALNKNKQAIKAIRTCIFFSLILGITAGGLILLFSDFITNKCLHNMVSSKPLFYIAIGLPFIAMSSCINSYFTSIRKAYKNAITQVFEFTIKMIATIILLKINIANGVEAICISLILADVISEVCSFTLILILYIIDIKLKKLEEVRSFGQRLNILKIAFPVAITSYIRSGLSTLKQLIIPTRLEKSGISCSNALSQYGMINGMVLPVITFPTVLTDSYSMLLIPEFSTYVAQKNYKAINFIANKILRLHVVFLCVFVVYFLSFQMNWAWQYIIMLKLDTFLKFSLLLSFSVYGSHYRLYIKRIEQTVWCYVL